MATKIEIDASKFERVGAKKLENIIKSASVSSINKSLISTRVKAIEVIGAATGLKRAGLVKLFRMYKAEREKLKGSLYIEKFGRVPLGAFAAKKVVVQSARGKRIGVSITMNGLTQIVPGGFLATMKSGKRAIFARDGKDRLPIHKLFSDQLHTLTSIDALSESLNSFAQETFLKNYNHEFEYYSKKLGK